MHRFCGWLFRTKYYIKKGYDSIAVSSIWASYGDGPDFLMMKRKKTESGML